MRVINLNGQSDGVEQDQDEHDVFKSCGVDDGPELILDWILWDVKLQWLSLQSVLHTLTLKQKGFIYSQWSTQL